MYMLCIGFTDLRVEYIRLFMYIYLNINFTEHKQLGLLTVWSPSRPLVRITV